MSERIQRQRRAEAREEAVTAPLTAGQRQTEAIDAVLAEIDDVLQSDAEEYVKGFVQKGGE